jgi:hypothetical protein
VAPAVICKKDRRLIFDLFCRLIIRLRFTFGNKSF